MPNIKIEELCIPKGTLEERLACWEVGATQAKYQTALLVDVNNVMYRLAFATSGEISTPEDMLACFREKVTATVGEVMADVVVCAIDHGVTLRRSMIGAAKKPSKSIEQEAVIQLARDAIRLLRDNRESAFNPRYLRGYEADDIIAGYACSGMFVHSVMYSTDSDLYQMTNGGTVSQLSPASGSFVKSTIEADKIVAVKSLVGDKSDSIVGLKGVGVKTANKIISGEKVRAWGEGERKKVLTNVILVSLPFPGTHTVINQPLTSWIRCISTVDGDEVDCDI